MFTFFCLSFSASAQQSITGNVINEQNRQVLADANVVLLPLNSGAVTDEKGNFEIRNINEGRYEMVVSMVGYQNYRQEIVVEEGKEAFYRILLKPDNLYIDEVDILGEGAEQRLLRQPDLEPASLQAMSSTIQRHEIMYQGAVTLVDALKYVPGALVETRGRKVKQFFSVRGQMYPYPTYSMDGVWQKEFHETVYFINAANIESIEVVRSASAMLKSLSPLAGVIDVRSRQYSEAETTVLARYGSLNTFQTSLTHGNKIEDVHYSGGVQYSGTNGPEGRNGQERIVNANARLDWQMNDKLNAGFKVFYLGGSRQLVQPIEPADEKFRLNQEKYDPLNTFLLTTKLAYQPNSRLSSELYMNYSHRNPTYHNLNTNSGEVSSYQETDYEVTINQLNALKLSESNVLRVGALYNHWVAPEGKRYYYGKRGDVHTFSGVITDQQRWGKWLLDAGLRVTQEYFKEWGGFSIEGSGGKFKNVAPIKDEWQSPVWQATAGATYAANAVLSWHLNVASGIVTPRKGALTPEGEQPANEKRTNVDLGLIRHFNKTGHFKLATFAVNRREAIDYNGETIELENGDIMELYSNVDKRQYGVEVDTRLPLLGSWLTGSANVTFMLGENKEESTWVQDDEIPEFIANTGIHVLNRNIDCNLFVNYTGAFKNDRFVSKNYLQEFGKAPLGDFWTVNVTAGYTMGKKKGTRLFVEAMNLLDEAFQTVPGYPDYGRHISLGVNWTF
jgi:outer membrane cobalamin receptor